MQNYETSFSGEKEGRIAKLTTVSYLFYQELYCAGYNAKRDTHVQKNGAKQVKVPVRTPGCATVVVSGLYLP